MDALPTSTSQRREAFQAQVVAVGDALVPDGTNDQRIAAIAAALPAPASTVRKWLYGFAAPRGVAAQAVARRLQEMLSERGDDA